MSANTCSSTLLPAELTDAVIDMLADDSTTLKSCSLVCRLWRIRSQYCLLSTLKLSQHTPLRNLAERLAHPLLTGYISHIHLDPAFLPPTFWDAFGKIMPHLPAFNSVSFKSKQMCKVQPEAWDIFTRYSSTIQSLAFGNIIFDTLCAFTKFLNGFPHITSLYVEYVTWGSALTPAERQLPPRKLTSLRELHLYYCTERAEFTRWLLNECPPDDHDGILLNAKLPIKSLCLTWHERTSKLQNALNILGPRLEHLSLPPKISSAARHIPLEDPGPILDLSVLENLKTLVICSDNITRYKEDNSTFTSLSRMLTTLTSPHISKITFALKTPITFVDPISDKPSWNLIDAALSHPHLLSRLRTVEVQCPLPACVSECGMMRAEAARRLREELLPKTGREKGLLVVCAIEGKA
ncbi:hypothetical protein K474DRAFT_1678881 [Panus rudis PR-1116 ss-1]|nr:hypothetical protein K474DRAFT_1678881 [Panus rudis PR-1116 ss-1]